MVYSSTSGTNADVTITLPNGATKVIHYTDVPNKVMIFAGFSITYNSDKIRWEVTPASPNTHILVGTTSNMIGATTVTEIDTIYNVAKTQYCTPIRIAN